MILIPLGRLTIILIIISKQQITSNQLLQSINYYKASNKQFQKHIQSHMDFLRMFLIPRPQVIVSKENIKTLIKNEEEKKERNKARLQTLLLRNAQQTSLVAIQAQISHSIWHDIEDIANGNLESQHLRELKRQMSQILQQCLSTGTIRDVQGLAVLNDQVLNVFLTEIGNNRDGLSSAAFDRIPFFKHEINQSEEHDICSVCHENYAEGVECIKLQCTHVFHRQCIKQWLRLKKNCPLCKQEVKAPRAG